MCSGGVGSSAPYAECAEGSSTCSSGGDRILYAGTTEESLTCFSVVVLYMLEVLEKLCDTFNDGGLHALSTVGD